MELKKIDISGFKSFANKTVLDFSPALQIVNGKRHYGVTAIVGPNGSGKSNVSDALRWVMGEQSLKGLRAKRSDDVIFAGSHRKARLNAATVTLHFDNCEKVGADFSEVTVSRTVYRDGGGEYRINDAKARLSDVVDLLAKAGIGKGSYTVITQGMTDAMLSATPLERRTIIEDAAGVKAYQIKKHRALLKLDRTLDNLEKVTALIAEIEPQLKMLKRQAERAERAGEVAEKLRQKQKTLYRHRWLAFKKEQAEILRNRRAWEEKISAKQREVEELTAEVRHRSRLMQQDQSKEEDVLSAEKRELEKKLSALNEKLAISKGRIAVERERAAREIAALKSRVPVDTAYVKEHLSQIIELAASSLTGEISGLKETLKRVTEKLERLLADVNKGSVEVDVSAQKRQIVERTEKIIESEQKICDELAREQEKILAQMNRLDERLLSGAAKRRQERAELFRLEEKLRAQHAQLDELREKFNETKIRLARVEVREEDLSQLIRNELQMSPEELEAEEGGQSVEDEAALEREVNRLRAQHESAGALDPLVIEEYKQVKERYDFLNTQSEDLQKAVADSHRVVKEMDRKIEAAFRRAFGKINKEFAHYFRMLFGGGKASLKKVEIPVGKSEKDESEEEEKRSLEDEAGTEKKHSRTRIGIAISAQPPGKKVSDLAVLSGGERSLVSLAFLFALISHNPPPFVLLDEVEAALDEANARRFAEILRNLAQTTQFIVITHNRETMRAAKLLYGVTMNADGISRLLSVKLDQVDEQGNIEESSRKE